jgi:hypothetical protein
VGELVQHDTSYHLWAPQAATKWYLITSIDDHSRDFLYADLWERESSWAHIVAVKTVVTSVGCPLKYYVDNHSIFRFIEKRDTVWQKAHAKEEDASVQWKEVLKDLGIEIVYALSPAAKGKVERPYRWIQDHLVRTCVRDGITTLEQAREVLDWELTQYRFKRIHSTTREIPHARFEAALREKRTLFRPFVMPKPYQTLDDIFCFRFTRTVDPYRRISFHTLRFAIHGVPIREEVELRISSHPSTRMVCIRFWYRGRLVGQQEVKAVDLPKVHF